MTCPTCVESGCDGFGVLPGDDFWPTEPCSCEGCDPAYCCQNMIVFVSPPEED